ncbi:TPA: hypothetical protein PNM84_001332 [Listeria monocytogenes]|nr:hypothetical protein [Listeria monocytogenes]HAA9071011.1 hypothetical protein [Listeria monocytogenes]HDI4828564.1 hypothetical protein [Listeria monocytogenes]HDM9928145.1 hypothetical protein [Listeria monocytogenes]
MINWEDIRYDIGAATRDFNKLEVKVSSIEPINPRSELNDIRKQLIEARDELYEIHGFDNANKLDYKFDLLFGLKLFQILPEDIGFTNRVATSDDIWRYLSIVVIPDIVHARWQLNEVHFYKTPRRIWLKTLWWYINLSWKGTEEDTYEILKGNTTDTILQMVERPGIGYYTDMYREIMSQYANYEDSSRELFRRVLKLNTARLVTTSPELVDGGIQAYVKDLFDSAVEE